MEFRLLSLVLLLARFIVAADPLPAGKCYWPNGDMAPANFIQCPGQTNCCASTESCLSNSLCYEAHLNVAYRGACADDSWPISECTRVCYSQVADTWANLYGCPNNTNQQFTCGPPGQWVPELCDSDMDRYDWDINKNFRVSYAEMPQPNTTASASLSLLSASATSTSTSTQSSTPGSLSSPSAEAATCTAPGDGMSSHEKVALAAGLGAGLGVPLLLVSVGFLVFWMRTKKQLQEARAQAQGYANALHQSRTGMMGAPAELSSAGAPAKELANSEVRGELEA